MDSSPHLLRVRVFVQTPEANVRQHPYYTIATFAKYAPPTCGPHFRYSHLEHDDIAIANDVGCKHSIAGRNLLRLITTGDQLSWQGRDAIIKQYYLASLATADLHLLHVVHESGLAPRTHANTGRRHQVR